MGLFHRSRSSGFKENASQVAGAAPDAKGRLGWGSRVALIGTGWKLARRHPGAAMLIGGALALMWMARANGRAPRQLH